MWPAEERAEMKIEPPRPRDWGALLHTTVPLIQWLPTYQRNSFPSDFTAGLTLSAYAIPVSVAYASLAGLP